MDKTWAARTIGASNKASLAKRVQMHDGFSSPRIAVETLLDREDFSDNIWEPAAGLNRITRVLRRYDHRVYTSDIHPWIDNIHEIRPFEKFRRLPRPFRKSGCDIITNPPFKDANLFALHALDLLHEGDKLALLLRTQFLEGQTRYRELFSVTPPKRVYVYAFRLPRMHRFFYEGNKGGNTLAFAWFVWQKGWQGEPRVRWISKD